MRGRSMAGAVRGVMRPGRQGPGVRAPVMRGQS